MKKCMHIFITFGVRREIEPRRRRSLSAPLKKTITLLRGLQSLLRYCYTIEGHHLILRCQNWWTLPLNKASCTREMGVYWTNLFLERVGKWERFPTPFFYFFASWKCEENFFLEKMRKKLLVYFSLFCRKCLLKDLGGLNPLLQKFPPTTWCFFLLMVTSRLMKVKAILWVPENLSCALMTMIVLVFSVRQDFK